MKLETDGYNETRLVNKLNTLKKQLVFSLCSVLLLFIMYCLTTYAWYTESIMNRGNEIATGNFKAILELSNDGETFTPPEGGVDIAPGESKFYFRVSSTGTLPLNYEIVFKLPEGVKAEGDISGFSNTGLQPGMHNTHEATFINNNAETALVGIEFLTVFNNSTIAKAWSLDDIAAAPDYSTVFLMNDIEGGSLILDKPVNLNLNGYTLKLDDFIIDSGDFFTMDVCNGKISLPAGSNIDRSNAPNVILNLDGIDLLVH